MVFKPLDLMWERVAVARSDSDTAFFVALMYAGELLLKITVAGLASAVDDDRDRSRYRHLYELVRADGLGDWSRTLDEILGGPSSQHLLPEAKIEARQLTEKASIGSWQREAVESLHACLRLVDPTCEDLPAKIDAKRWFAYFARLRNKSPRGHGAPPEAVVSQICPPLERSLRLVAENLGLFNRQWAFLHRNLSGKYRVTALCGSAVQFEPLKSSTSEAYNDGVYVFLGSPRRVDLIESTIDAVDFYVANGGFTEKRFELMSYSTGDKLEGDSAAYLGPIGPLPGSETEGIGRLELLGQCFTNLPAVQPDYVSRAELESDLKTVLRMDRHPVVTLVGRGGIGKTSLALAALKELSDEDRYQVILWFSARDLDLRPEGPKRVRPAVLNVRDISEEYVRLVEPRERFVKGFKAQEHLAKALATQPEGPTLYIFDNFETVTNPTEVFKWIDTHIRPPNKILITTRYREFKGDYAIDVRGMTEPECNRLIDSTSHRLGVSNLLTSEYRQQLIAESDGHPYVIRILIGDIAKLGKLKPVERILADADDILPAIFERTYANLSPTAQRVFLTLCSWRSTIPMVAMEAVLLRPENEKMPVADAVEELERSSFVDVVESQTDKQPFLSTPLVAAVFGKRKLAASPMKSAVEADLEMLHLFGAGQLADVRHGVGPRVERVVRYVARKASQDGEDAINTYLPMLEFIARAYAPTWLLLAELFEESGTSLGISSAKDAVRRYLESAPAPDRLAAWTKLAELCRRSDDVLGEVHALVEMSDMESTPFADISNAANRLNSLLYARRSAFDSEEERVLIRRLAAAMEARIGEADATDCSRLAWLYAHSANAAAARKYAERGLSIDPDNEYCLKLVSFNYQRRGP